MQNDNGEILIKFYFQEPTTGLDSTTACNLIDMLQKYAAANKKTVITSIHQPSSQIFYKFDKLMLLSEGEVIIKGQCLIWYGQICLLIIDSFVVKLTPLFYCESPYLIGMLQKYAATFKKNAFMSDICHLLQVDEEEVIIKITIRGRSDLKIVMLNLIWSSCIL